MTETTTPPTNQLDARRRYRRVFYACILAGSAGLLVASTLDYHLLGVAVYWAGVVGALAILRGTTIQLYDERDVALERRASLVTVYVVGAVAVLGIPGAVAMAELGYVTLPAELLGAIYGYVGLCAIWAVTYVWLRFGR